MEYQTPAKGITAMQQFDDAKFFRVPCSCGCDSEVDLGIEADDDSISVSINAITKTAYWKQYFDVNHTEGWMLYTVKMFANDWINRLAICQKALFHGYVETSSYVIMDKQQAFNLSETITRSISEIEDHRASLS